MVDNSFSNEMFMLDRAEVIDRSITKKDYYRYEPSNLASVNGANTVFRINIPREDTVISLHDSYCGGHGVYTCSDNRPRLYLWFYLKRELGSDPVLLREKKNHLGSITFILAMAIFGWL